MSPIAPSDRPPAERSIEQRNQRLALVCVLIFAGMVGAAFAAVPIYRAFCQLTGFDGKTRRAVAAPGQVLNQSVVVRFDTNIRDLPWTFTSERISQTVKIGETGLTYFKVTNNGKTPLTGHAVYNVMPQQAGPYFQKLECFCFSDQTIGAGKTVEFPVVYFIDPKYATDLNTKNQGEVTLSYTFYPAVAAKQAQASQEKPASALGGTPRTGL